MTNLFKYLPLLLILLNSCGSAELSEEEGAESTKKAETQELINNLNSELSSIIQNSSDSIALTFYSIEEPVNYWYDDKAVLNTDAIQFIDMISHAENYGLNSDQYYNTQLAEKIKRIHEKNTSIEDMAHVEIELSESYLKFASHISNGMLRDAKKYTDLKTKTDTSTVEIEMTKGKLIDYLNSIQPKHHEYVKLQLALTKFLKSSTINDSVVFIPNFRKDSIKAYDIAKEILVKLNYLSTDAKGNQIVDAVKLFQKNNGLTPDGLIGKYTSQMLEYSTSQIYYQAAITLEKWRWLENWGTNYFFANIPEFSFKVYDNDSLVINNRTVVGTAYTPTPEIESKLKYFIVNPEWHVPYSITTKELIPKMKKDSTYLSRNGYAISSKGIGINDIDWANANPSTFSYSIKQKSGSSNALGKVKFIFDNKHSVYFHDTPSKSFFDKEIRSYSHGCVRLQDPFEVVNYIIEKEQKDNWANLVDSMLVKKTTKTFSPENIYPIHIGYFPSVADSSGNIRTLIDIYQKNESLLKDFKNAYHMQ